MKKKRLMTVLNSVFLSALIVVSSGVIISVSASAQSPTGPPKTETFEGTLQTGVVAIGGETTGIVLKTEKNGQYELDFNKNEQLQKLAGTLNGKRVVVKGTYQPRPGVEVKERRIILVSSLTTAK